MAKIGPAMLRYRHVRSKNHVADPTILIRVRMSLDIVWITKRNVMKRYHETATVMI